MRVTKSNIKSIFNTDNVKQIDSKQLFIINDKFIVSYRTIIGIISKEEGILLTEKYYSSTTQRHKYYICKVYNYLSVTKISQEELERLCK